MNDQPSPSKERLAYELGMADQLCDALEEATGGKVTDRKSEVVFSKGSRLDLLLEVEADGRHLRLAVETLGKAYPRDVRDAVWRLEDFLAATRASKDDLVKLVAAESLSAGAKETLRQRGIGYFDGSGSLFLRSGPWIINIERPAPRRARKDSVPLFTDAREGVVHALLKCRGEWLTGSELAELAKTSNYTCSVVLKELERREWVESTGAGYNLRRRLVEPAKLLDAWAEEWTERKYERLRGYLFVGKPSELLPKLASRLKNAGMDWAFTGTAAANVAAPLLTSADTAEIIVPKGASPVLKDMLDLKPAEKGSNVTLIEREGASLLFRDLHQDDMSYFASPFILYLDLLDGRGRNKELAQHLRQSVLNL
jgi:hypothetical protein